MKKLLCIVLILAMLPVSVFADSQWLTELDENNIRINDQLELYSGDYVNSSNNGLLSENYFVYEPGEGAAPLICFGNDVAGAAGFSRVMEIESGEGNTIVAGTNGDYFTMATGVAMGLMIKNGRICSSERSSCESIGFKAEGSMLIGSPDLNVSVSLPAEGVLFQRLCFNKTLTDGAGLVVYSDDFGPDNGAGRHFSAVVRISEGECVPGGEVSGVIESVGLCEKAQPLEEGTLVLSVLEGSKYVSLPETFQAMQVGDEVTVSFAMAEEWLDVVNAIGAERRLVSGGEISGNILSDGTDNTRAPRTAFGLRSDGTAVVYTADGRDSSHSTGLLYRELAQRMLDLGCVEAVNLDGGASTQLYAGYPGKEKVTQVNQSSGDSVRRCANYLTFINTAEQTGELARLHIYPFSKRVMAGAVLPLSISATDSGWYALDASGIIPVWTVSGAEGSIDGSTFTAGREGGTALVSAYSGSASGSAEIEIITKPDELNVTYTDGKALPSRLYVYAEDSVSLKPSVTYKRKPLYSEGDCFAWHTEEELGSIENGVFTAASEITVPVEGFITVVAGECAKSIPVTVYRDEEAPVITAEVSGNLLMGSVTDIYDPKFGKSSVSVRIDGARADFEMTETGGVYVTLPQADGKLHHAVIEAVDSVGHKSRLGVVIPPIASGNSTELPETSPLFADLPDTDAYFPYAEYLSRRGIMSGKLSGEVINFDKDAPLTRQEFAAVLCKWLRIKEGKYENVSLDFTDSDKISPWALSYVKAVCKIGYMNGKAKKDGTVDFDPLGSITRQEVLTVLSRFLGEGYPSEELKCSDAAAVASWALPYAELAVTNGITDPGEGMLRPLDPITRGELGIMMYSLD